MEAQLFYKELGRLLYAIAAADGMVTEPEMVTLKRLVKEELVPQEEALDHFGSDKAYFTEFEFDVLSERNATAAEAFDSFLTYMSGHHHDLSEDRKQLIYRSADTVAKAFHGVGKKEIPYLTELHRQLDHAY